jgi:glyoxylase-like metal-dependent hydrolase (beta-lactamase superfamily II)
MSARPQAGGAGVLEQAARAGIHCLAIPTPFAVGRVNAYLIEDEPLTLVDSGPNSGKALDELERALAALGHSISDLGLLVVTHHHMDHLGLVDILARRSGAAVAALAAMAPILGDYGAAMEREDVLAKNVMRLHGIPVDVLEALGALSRAMRGWGASTTVTRPVHDGDTIELRDRTLRVHHRPGHSTTDTLLADDGSGIVLVADHLLRSISSNALIALPLEAHSSDEPVEADPRRRGRQLLTYLDSLRLTREMPAEIMLGGHGPPVVDHPAVIDKRFKLHRRRAERIRRMLVGKPQTGYEIAQELWGSVAVTQAYLALSEVLGHLDILLEEGQVSEEDDGDVVRYVAT